jgi:hypothetical protein
MNTPINKCPNLQKLLEDPTLIKSNILAFFYGRSGSFLLSSLLDNHPQVLSTPPTGLLSFYQNFFEWLMQNSSQVSEHTLMDFLIKNCPNLFCKDNRYPELGSENSAGYGANIDDFKDAFQKGIRSLIQIGKADFHGLCCLIQVAYAYATNRRINTTTPIAIWQNHLPLPFDQQLLISQTLPNCKFLYSVRLGEKSFDSHIHHSQKEVGYHPDEIYRNRMCYHFLQDDAVHPSMLERSIAVRFEDVHADTENIMRTLAKWLEINWDNCLLDSTVDGKPFAFISHGKSKEGTNPAVAKDRTTKRLFWLDKLKVRYLLERNYLAWEYPLGLAYRLLKNNKIKEIIFNIPSKYELEVCWDEIKKVWEKHRAIQKETKKLIFESHQRCSKNTCVIPLLTIDQSRSDYQKNAVIVADKKSEINPLNT